MKTILLLALFNFILLGDIKTIIGESNTLNPDVASEESIEPELTSSNSCNCSEKISETYNDASMQVENYTEATIESLKKLREQVAKNKNELANRSDNIINDKYYETLNNTIKYINSDISNHKDITKIKLSGYNNLLLLSNNGFVYKNNNLLNVYSIINELEQLENKLKILSIKE